MTEQKRIRIQEKETKQALAIFAHLRRIYETASIDGKLYGPTRLDHADLLLCSASLRALLFDVNPILLSFLEYHQHDIQVETLEIDLNLFILSFSASDEWHISDFLVKILLDPETKAAFPLNKLNQMLFAFQDGTGFQAPAQRSDLWIPAHEDALAINTSLGLSHDGAPEQFFGVTRRVVPISEWGNFRVGYLKTKPIKRSNLITYVANKLGGVHYDTNRLPPDDADPEQYRVLATAYDWDNQAIMHTGLVAVGLACVEVLRAPGIMPLLRALGEFHQNRQEWLMRGDRNVTDDRPDTDPEPDRTP